MSRSPVPAALESQQMLRDGDIATDTAPWLLTTSSQRQLSLLLLTVWGRPGLFVGLGQVNIANMGRELLARPQSCMPINEHCWS